MARTSRPRRFQIEHDVGHPLARPVIGELAAAAGLEDGKAVRAHQILRLRARAGGVEGRMLEQPHLFRRVPAAIAAARASMAASGSG